jgi:hypothetical protein
MNTHYSITQETRRERNYKFVWVCRTGNIETMSTISRERAEALHTKKIAEINKQEHNTELFCYSY